MPLQIQGPECCVAKLREYLAQQGVGRRSVALHEQLQPLGEGGVNAHLYHYRKT
jgi:hypothetical protein